VRRQAIGISDPAMAPTMLGALQELGAEHVLVFRGDDGLDELTTTTTSTVHELVDGAVREYTLDPMDFGLARADTAALAGGDAARNAEAIRSVLAGDKGATRDIAVLNAAAAVVVAGIAPDFGAGVEVAAEALDSGRAAGALDALVRVSADALVRENDGS